ncbi:hypothetical protein MM239_14775 [Belliella sp. DSM 111904]|uniref:Uncharacterized protein n=1 Tax=Belliella filtrata TaxID=2923435 RepID=A0ABS9V2M6_9BACT|nr:hypothetical protein [Belliella filtrata]MCH7410669.1 hypothetical protein [Belliella filtrata]
MPGLYHGFGLVREVQQRWVPCAGQTILLLPCLPVSYSLFQILRSPLKLTFKKRLPVFIIIGG